MEEDWRWKEFRNEIPYNTLKSWSRSLIEGADWQHVGWSGAAQEPFRHWACYPEFNGILVNIWDAINAPIKDEGLHIKPERIVLNMYNHGDSSWLHKDSDGDKEWTVIVFMNDYWDLNWGGDFVLVENNEILASFAATPGKYVVFKSNILHAARPVGREAPLPRFGIAFQCKPDDNNVQELKKPKISAFSTIL